MALEAGLFTGEVVQPRSVTAAPTVPSFGVELIGRLIVLRLGSGLVHGDVLRPDVAALHLPAPHGAAGVHILPAGDGQGLSLLHQPSRHGPRLIQQVHRRADVDGFCSHHVLGVRHQLLTAR